MEERMRREEDEKRRGEERGREERRWRRGEERRGGGRRRKGREDMEKRMRRGGRGKREMALCWQPAPYGSSPKVLRAELRLEELEELVSSGGVFEGLLQREAPPLDSVLVRVPAAHRS